MTTPVTVYAGPAGGWFLQAIEPFYDGSSPTSSRAGGSPIEATNTSLVEGGTITITTDGTHDFGSLAPRILARWTLNGLTAGDPLQIPPPEGVATVVANAYGAPEVEDIAALPYGKGMAIGSLLDDTNYNDASQWNKVTITDSEFNDDYCERCYLYFPAANQTNALAGIAKAMTKSAVTATATGTTGQLTSVGHGISVGGKISVWLAGFNTTPDINGGHKLVGVDVDTLTVTGTSDQVIDITAVVDGVGTYGFATWQQKTTWHVKDTGWDDADTDMWHYLQNWITTSNAWGNNWQISTNDTSRGVDSVQVANGFAGADSQHLIDEPVFRDIWISPSATLGATSGTKGYYRTTGTTSGLLADSDYADAYSFSTTANRGFNNHTLPGYNRGFHIPDNQHIYYADYMLTANDSSCMAIYLTDTALFASRTKQAVCIPTAVSSTETSAPIKEGIFSATSLSGAYIHLQLADGTIIENIGTMS